MEFQLFLLLRKVSKASSLLAERSRKSRRLTMTSPHNLALNANSRLPQDVSRSRISCVDKLEAYPIWRQGWHAVVRAILRVKERRWNIDLSRCLTRHSLQRWLRQRVIPLLRPDRHSQASSLQDGATAAREGALLVQCEPSSSSLILNELLLHANCGQVKTQLCWNNDQCLAERIRQYGADLPSHSRRTGGA